MPWTFSNGYKIRCWIIQCFFPLPMMANLNFRVLVMLFMRKSDDNNPQCFPSISCNKELSNGQLVLLPHCYRMQLDDSWTATVCLESLTIDFYTFGLWINWENSKCKLEILQFSDVEEFQIWGCRSKASVSWQNWNSQRKLVSFWWLCTKTFPSLINKVFCLLMRQHQINSRKSNT